MNTRAFIKQYDSLESANRGIDTETKNGKAEVVSVSAVQRSTGDDTFYVAFRRVVRGTSNRAYSFE